MGQDLALSVLVDRTALGLDPLECNDWVSYKISGESGAFFGGQMVLQRTQVGGPYTDGMFTTDRQAGNVTEPVKINVFGRHVAGQQLTHARLQQNINTQLAAWSQNSFLVTATVNQPGAPAAQQAVYQYLCEAADYSVGWDGNWFSAVQAQLSLSPQRQPFGLMAGIA